MAASQAALVRLTGSLQAENDGISGSPILGGGRAKGENRARLIFDYASVSYEIQRPGPVAL